MAAPDPIRLVLPADPASVRAARRLVEEVVAGVLDDERTEDALVVTSELVTNAVLHVGTELELVVVVAADTVRIEVHDRDPRPPRRKRYSASSGTGRGLVLVESLATIAGVDRREDGKVVWAVFGGAPVEPPVAIGSSADDGRPDDGGVDLAVLGIAEPVEAYQVAASDDAPDLRAQLDPLPVVTA